MPRGIMPILRNARRAIIDERKLMAYVLNPVHPRGRDKARIQVRSRLRPGQLRAFDRADTACHLAA
jgi:hypothetical protein